MVQGKAKALRTLDENSFLKVERRVYFVADVGQIFVYPRMFGADILRKSGVLISQASAGLGGTYSAKSRTEPFAQPERFLRVAVLVLDDEGLAVNPDAPGRKSERFDLMLQYS